MKQQPQFGTILVVLTVVLMAVLAACTGGGTQNIGTQNTADTTPPTLTSSAPANNAVNVQVNSNIKLVFNEKMDTASVTVIGDPSSDLGNPSWNATGTELNLKPPANLEPSTAYTLSIEGKDATGNALGGTKTVQFTTAANIAPPDTNAPTIVSSSPENGNAGAAINSNILVTFSEPMNPGSITVSLNPSVNLGAPTFKSDNAAIEFDPPADLSGNTDYTVNVTGKDVAGNALTGSSSFTFKTATTKDTTAPGTPQNLNATAEESQIKLTWSANTETDLKGYTIYYGTNAADLSSKVFISKPAASKTVTGLTNGLRYYLQIEAEDGAGNRSGKSNIVNATPKDVTPPKLLSSLPKNGAVNVSATTSKVVFNFSEPMQPTSNLIAKCFGQENNTTSVCNYGRLPEWSNDSKTMTLTYDAPEYMGNANTRRFELDDYYFSDKAGNQLATTAVEFTIADTIEPKLLSSVPANGATNVPLNLPEVKFTFSEPINQSTFKVKCIGVYAAIEQCHLDLAALLGPATWSEGHTVTFRPTKPLLSYRDYGLIPLGTDLAGNALPNTQAAFDAATQVWFVTAKNVTTVVMPFYGGGYIVRGTTRDTAYINSVISVGDSGTGFSQYSRGYLAFKINSIPANATVTAARLQVSVTGAFGNPFGTLGSLILERVDVPQIVENPYNLNGTQNHFDLPALACTGCPIVLTGAYINQNVLGFVLADRTNSKAGSQFRLRFTENFSANGTGDYLTYSKNTATLTVTYETP
jgi:methionine-rich copper-binding protein CopC